MGLKKSAGVLVLAAFVSCAGIGGASAGSTVSCNQLAAIAAAAPDFKAYQGKKVPSSGQDGGGAWTANISLAGGRCFVSDGGPDDPPEFSCSWQSHSQSDVAQRSRALLAAIRSCRQWHIAQSVPDSQGPWGGGNKIVSEVLLTEHHRYGFKVEQDLMVRDTSQTVLDVFRGKDYDDLTGGN